MKLFRVCAAVCAAVTGCAAATSSAALVSDWVVTRGAANIAGANTSTPVFDNAGGMDVVGGFPTISLASGEFVQVSATVTVTGGDASYSDQLRIGLFREDESAPEADDGAGYTGVSVAYLNVAREHHDPARNEIFTSGGAGAPATIGSAGTDPESDTINTANFTATFTLRIARDGSNLDISGSIVAPLNNFSQLFAFNDYVPTTTVANKYDFNRVGFLIGSVGGSQLAFTNVDVTTNVPEPATWLLAAGSLTGCVLARRRRR